MATNNPTVYLMSPANVDLANSWAILEEGINHIMTKLPTGVPYLMYMTLYTALYTYCTSSKPLEGGETLGVAGQTGVNLRRFDMYNKLIRFLVTHLGSLKDAADSLQDEALLQCYAREWDQYTAGVKCLNPLFTYVNRHWVKRERDEGRKNVYPVKVLCLILWKDNFLIPIQNENSKLAGAILRLIERQRDGQEIDEELVKKVVGSFVSLGLDEADIDGVCLDVYKEHFEIPFLEATGKYYELKSGAFLAGNSVSDYLGKAEEWLREEEDRVERYLNVSTKKLLINKCVHVLVRGRPELVHENSQRLLDLLDYDDEDL